MTRYFVIQGVLSYELLRTVREKLIRLKSQLTEIVSQNDRPTQKY